MSPLQTTTFKIKRITTKFLFLKTYEYKEVTGWDDLVAHVDQQWELENGVLYAMNLAADAMLNIETLMSNYNAHVEMSTATLKNYSSQMTSSLSKMESRIQNKIDALKATIPTPKTPTVKKAVTKKKK